MSRLRDRMRNEMELKNFSASTKKNYINCVKSFANYFGKSPAELGEEEIRTYLRYLSQERKVSWSLVNVTQCAIRFLYAKVLERPWSIQKIPRPRKERKLPIVLAKEEIKAILDSVDNKKHRTILMTIYSTGVRISEASHLKVSDIDGKRMTVRVEQGKGKKDRYTLLSAGLLKVLRDYWVDYRPKSWLFPGNRQENPISVSAIQMVFKNGMEKSGIKKAASVHTLRHSFATRLIERGVDLFTVQHLLGHKSLRTTSVYARIQNSRLEKIVNPLDTLLV